MPSTVLCRGVAGAPLPSPVSVVLSPRLLCCLVAVLHCVRQDATLGYVSPVSLATFTPAHHRAPMNCPLNPPHAAVSALPCVEHDGFVWVWPGWEEPTLPLPTFTRPPEGYRIHAGGCHRGHVVDMWLPLAALPVCPLHAR